MVSVKLFKWFHENGMKANQYKCHFLSNLDIIFTTCLHTRKFTFPKIFGGTIERNLNFNKYVTNTCDKASRKFKHSQKCSHRHPKPRNDF